MDQVFPSKWNFSTLLLSVIIASVIEECRNEYDRIDENEMKTIDHLEVKGKFQKIYTKIVAIKK